MDREGDMMEHINLLRNFKHEPPFIEGLTKEQFKNYLTSCTSAKGLKIYEEDGSVKVIRCVCNYYDINLRKCVDIRHALHFAALATPKDCLQCHKECLTRYEKNLLDKKV